MAAAMIPAIAAPFSSKTMNDGRILRPPDRLEPVEIALRGPEFLEGFERRPSFEQKGDQEDRERPQRRHGGLGMRDVDDALVDRNSGAKGKHEHRDHEAPEVEFAAVAERVKPVGRPLRRRRPHIRSSWLVELTTLCTPSVSMADEPVIPAATNFDTAIPRFARSAMTSVRVLVVGALVRFPS